MVKRKIIMGAQSNSEGFPWRLKFWSKKTIDLRLFALCS